MLLEIDPKYQERPESLKKISFRTPQGGLVPLEEVMNIKEDVGPQSVNHYGQLPAVSISFGLKPGASLGAAIDHVNQTRPSACCRRRSRRACRDRRRCFRTRCRI